MQQHTQSDQLTGAEAAALLGVDLKNLATLLGRYGVGRHYEARPGDEFVYDRREIEKIKANLGVKSDGEPT